LNSRWLARRSTEAILTEAAPVFAVFVDRGAPVWLPSAGAGAGPNT